MENNKLESQPIGKLFLKLAAPAILAQIINALYNIVDRMYIGHIKDIGAYALTGVGICFPILMIISAFAALVGNGGAPIAAIKMGEKDNKFYKKDPYTAMINKPAYESHSLQISQTAVQLPLC